MTVPVWPSDLPRPTRGDYQASWQDPRIARQAETGPPGYRRRFSSVSRPVSLSIIVSRSGKARFDRFFTDDIAHGSRVFRMPDPTTDGWPLLNESGVPLLTETGAPILLSENWLCLMTAVPVERIYAQVEFQIAFQVDVLP